MDQGVPLGRRFPDFTIGKSGLTLPPRDAVRFPSYGLLALHPLLLLLLASAHLKPAARPATATSTHTTHASAAADTRSSCRATTTMPARCAATVAAALGSPRRAVPQMHCARPRGVARREG